MSAKGRDRAPRRQPPLRVGVAKAIRARVLSADLVPGQRLVEADICAWSGAGRSTVRAALLDLADEGLVELRTRCSARIRVVDTEEAVALASQRLSIERPCVVRAAERISDAEIARMRELAAALARCSDLGDIDGFAATTDAIRAFYIAIAGMPAAAAALARLRARSLSHRLRPAYRVHRARTAAPAWLAITEAICMRDGRAAGAALDRQTRLVQESMRAFALSSRPFAADAA